MTEDEVVEIVKESNLWETLSQMEQEEAISHALKITGTSITTEDTEQESYRPVVIQRCL
jgi:hypothetical protein